MDQHTKSKKQNLFILLTLLTISFFYIQTVNSSTYYLAPNGSDITGDGSYDNPWFSPSHARKSTGAIAPGDTVIFKDGIYNYDGSDFLLGYNKDDAGEYNNKITYIAENEHQAILNFSCSYGIRLDTPGSSNIVVQGFTVTNYYQCGASLKGYNQTVRNMQITASTTWPPDKNSYCKFTGGAGVETYFNASNFLIENNYINFASNNKSAHGIYMHGIDGTIFNNTIINNTGNGIQIQNNGNFPKFGEVYVYRNLIYNNGEHGIYVNAYNGGAIDSVYIENNIVASNGYIHQTDGFGITVSSDTNTIDYAKVVHNTIYNNRYGLRVLGVDNGSGLVANNIIYNSTLTVQNNDTYYDITEIGLTVEARDNFNSNTNPQFLSVDYNNQNFLKINKNSPAIDNGTYANTTIDFYGTSRPQGSRYDIGAYEYYENKPIPKPLNLSIEKSNYPQLINISLPPQTYKIYVDADLETNGNGSITSPYNSIISANNYANNNPSLRPLWIFMKGYEEIDGSVTLTANGIGKGQEIVFTSWDNSKDYSLNITPTYSNFRVNSNNIILYGRDFYSPKFRILGAYQALDLRGDNNTVSRIEITGGRYLGATVHSANNLMFVNNVMHDTRIGIYSNSGNNVDVSYNLIYNNTAYGVHHNCHYDAPSVGYANNWVYEGNLIYNSTSNVFDASGSPAETDCGHINNVTVLNNIISNQEWGWRLGQTSGLENCSSMNNISFYSNTFYNIKYYGLYSGYNHSKIGVAHNNLFVDVPIDITIAAGRIGWLNTSDNGNETEENILSTNLSKKYYMKLKNSSLMIDSGIFISDVQKDYFGIERPQGNGFDVGAYESESAYHEADLNKNSIIEFDELKAYLNLWFNHERSMGDVIEVIKLWKKI